jgi:hypothetical protein
LDESPKYGAWARAAGGVAVIATTKPIHATTVALVTLASFPLRPPGRMLDAGWSIPLADARPGTRYGFLAERP